MFGNSKTLNG